MCGAAGAHQRAISSRLISAVSELLALSAELLKALAEEAWSMMYVRGYCPPARFPTLGKSSFADSLVLPGKF